MHKLNLKCLHVILLEIDESAKVTHPLVRLDLKKQEKTNLFRGKKH